MNIRQAELFLNDQQWRDYNRSLIIGYASRDIVASQVLVTLIEPITSRARLVSTKYKVSTVDHRDKDLAKGDDEDKANKTSVNG